MKNKNIKIHYDSKVYLLFFLIFLLGSGLFIYKYLKKEDCTQVDFDVIAMSQTTGDLIEFNSTGENDFEWEWDFGDGSKKEYSSNVLHKFDSIGLYTVTLKVNNSCVVNKQIYIKKRVYIKQIDYDQVPTIEYPNEIREGDLVNFNCTSTFATKWEWRFVEASDVVQSTEKKAQFTFDEAGEHKISLVVNDSLQYVLIKSILVLPKEETRRRRRRRRDPINDVFGGIPDDPDTVEPPIDNKIKITRSEAKKILENYAAGKLDYKDIRHYFCSDNVRVVNAKGKISSLKVLLSTIRAKQIDIKDIDLYKNEKSGCVKRINIDLRYKGTLFWRKF